MPHNDPVLIAPHARPKLGDHYVNIPTWDILRAGTKSLSTVVRLSSILIALPDVPRQTVQSED